MMHAQILEYDEYLDGDLAFGVFAEGEEHHAAFRHEADARLYAASRSLLAALRLFVDPDKDQPEGTCHYEDPHGIDRCHYCHEESTHDDQRDGFVLVCVNQECPEKQARMAFAMAGPVRPPRHVAGAAPAEHP